MVKVLKLKRETKTVPVKENALKKESDVLDPRAESLRILSQFYIGETDLNMKSRQISIAHGKEVSDPIAALELLKDRVIITEDVDLKLKMYQAIADLLSSLGMEEDLHMVQGIVARVNLKSFKELGFEWVEVECAEDACPACKKMAGKRMNIDEAFESMPLPCQECTTEKGAVQGYCRCRYFAVF
ncbi:MAG TPA: hypothetical protein VMW85_07880 [Methanomassiliicoccales archaeon]|nr:hypothetical protein [Methanomassiliicoccales archaeon]